MKILKVKKIAKTSIKKSPVLSHKLQQAPINKSSQKVTKTQTVPMTIKQIGKAISLMLRSYDKKINVESAIKHSLKVDIERADTQLSAFYIKTVQENIFKFIVKSSGLHQKDRYQVDIMWDLQGMPLDPLKSKEIFLKAPIKFQCSCERHTYWYRYLWTKLGASLGLQEYRYPVVKNTNLEGMLCKHGLKVMKSIHKTAFQATFKRYIENKASQKQTRISAVDKVKVAGSGFGVGR